MDAVTVRLSPGWNAVGMMIAYDGEPSRDALARLRGHAFSHSLSLDELAGRLAGRQLMPEAITRTHPPAQPRHGPPVITTEVGGVRLLRSNQPAGVVVWRPPSRRPDFAPYITYIKKGGKAYGGKAGDFLGFAAGGSPRLIGKVAMGTYRPRADDVDVSVSRDEWIIQKPSAKKYGDGRMAAVNDGVAKIVLPGEKGYAFGGSPSRDYVSAGRGGTTVIHNHNHFNLSAPDFVGSQAELMRTLANSAKTGHLKGALREAGVQFKG